MLLLLKFVFALARDMCDSRSAVSDENPLHSFRYLADNLFTALFSYLPPVLPPSANGIYYLSFTPILYYYIAIYPSFITSTSLRLN